MKNSDYPDTDVVLMSRATVPSHESGRRNNASNCHPKGLAERLPKKSTRRDATTAAPDALAGCWMADKPSSAHHDKQLVRVEEWEARPNDDGNLDRTRRRDGIGTPMRELGHRADIISSCLAARAILTASRLVPVKGQFPADADVMG